MEDSLGKEDEIEHMKTGTSAEDRDHEARVRRRFNNVLEFPDGND